MQAERAVRRRASLTGRALPAPIRGARGDQPARHRLLEQGMSEADLCALTRTLIDNPARRYGFDPASPLAPGRTR